MRRKHYGKRGNCMLQAISPFPTVISKDLYCRQVKTRACLGKGLDVFDFKISYIPSLKKSMHSELPKLFSISIFCCLFTCVPVAYTEKPTKVGVDDFYKYLFLYWQSFGKSSNAMLYKND